MARKCAFTGKKTASANNVSHAKNKTKRTQRPNIQVKSIYVPELDKNVRVKVSTSALRTISKIGFMTYLKKTGLTLKQVTA